MVAALTWMAAGAGLVLAAGALAWLYWRYRGPGSMRDFIAADAEPEGRYRVLRRTRTAVQRIAVVEHAGHVLVYGNGYVMFSTEPGEDRYAEALVHVPMGLARRRERVLIIGAGGGITTREALKHPDVAEILAVDADPLMVHFGQNLDALVRFNGGSLRHPKVRVVIADGRAAVEQSSERWDVIIVDLPEPSAASPGLRRLFSREFYALLGARLHPGGVICVACATPSWMPEFFWSVHATLAAAGLSVLPYRYDSMVDDEEDWGFLLAAAEPLERDAVRITVPVRYLPPARVRELFHIPFGIMARRGSARVQTDSNDVMAELVE